MKSTLVAVLLISLLALPVLADGTVTTQVATPDRWELFDIEFVTRSALPKAAILTIGYLSGDAVVRTDEIRIDGEAHGNLMAAIGTSSGTDEASLTATLSDGTVVPDRAAIYTLRISRWLVSTGRLTGVTADPTPSE